jgi:aspartate 1-decarboxylase
MLKSKIHRATVTEANLNYEGSITVDGALMDAAELHPFEQVMVSNLNNGERLVTYVIPGKKGSGVICLNGPTARKGVVGDIVILFSYAHYDEKEMEKFEPIIVAVDKKNQITGITNKIGK